MQMTIQVEKPSKIIRKLTITVPAETVNNKLNQGFTEAQQGAKLKGFRPGQVPMSMVRQHYGEDVRHRVLHALIDESYEAAIREQGLQAVGSPRIETPENQTGTGAHDHSLKEDQALTYTATVEIMPDVEVKGYKGIALSRESVEVTDAQVEEFIQSVVESHAQLVPVTGGLVLADGTSSSRPIRKGDYVEMTFKGALVTENGLEEKAGMKGTRVVEVGSGQLIPGFEENLVDMRAGETKTFRAPFPEDFHDKSMAGKTGEFTVTVNELKEKKLPELNDEFVKQLGYENLAELRSKVREHLVRERAAESDRKLRSDLLKTLIEKNDFEVPSALIHAQTQSLIEDLVEHLKQRDFDEKNIQQLVSKELENLQKRAETQVRASLLLEAVARKEEIHVKTEEVEEEIKKIAVAMKVEEGQLQEFYSKNPGRRRDLEFRLREDRSVQFLLQQAKLG